MRLWKKLDFDKLRAPELICFDHLYSEYLSIKSLIKDDESIEFINGLPDKEKEGNLSWKDLYYFELVLINYLSEEQIRSKIVQLRSDYQSIAGQKEYTEYLASKPPNLQSPPEKQDSNMPDNEFVRLLQEDLKDLLSRIYLKYAILPVREKRLTDLTLFAARLCLTSLSLLLSILLTIFIIQSAADIDRANSLTWNINRFMNSDRLASLTIFVVVVAGAMGGFVSALQRIQSPPTEGDSLYNLALLFHGSKSIFVAPITGAIFATLLYMMFTAGILTGAFFPTINTPSVQENGAATAALSPTPQSNTNTAVSLDQPLTASSSNNQPAAGLSNAGSASPSPSPTPATKENPNATSKGLNIFDFLARSGPQDGKAYAMLIIWCFIAGFAERFVPDALDRLISNNKAGSTH
jgi:hypothetical protein